MYAERYRPQRVNRGSLGLSIGIVGPLVAAAMLSSGVIRTPFKDSGLPVWNVDPVEPPPPEPLPKPQPQTRAKPTPQVDHPLPQVQTEQPKAPWIAPPQPPALPTPGTGEGPGGGAAVEPVRPPAPVLTGIEVDPRYAAAFQPTYPPAEQRAGRDGLVTLRVLVGVDGRVVRVEQLTATSEEFWRVTQRQALGRWRFRPATRDGTPYEAWRTMTVRFRLEDQ